MLKNHTKKKLSHQTEIKKSGREFLGVWSKYYAWLCEFLDKTLNFGLLYRRAYGP